MQLSPSSIPELNPFSTAWPAVHAVFKIHQATRCLVFPGTPHTAVSNLTAAMPSTDAEQQREAKRRSRPNPRYVGLD
jgi:hypothetical protein